MKKRFFVFVIYFVLFLFLPELIPLKFAEKTNQIEYNKNTYVCEYVTATEGNWEALKQNNPHLDEDMCYNLRGDSSFYMLDDISDISSGMPIINKYIFYGKPTKTELSENVFINVLELENWDIVFPVKRNSVRGIYAPKHYLTIYDFNWSKILKSWFGQDGK